MKKLIIAHGMGLFRTARFYKTLSCWLVHPRMKGIVRGENDVMSLKVKTERHSLPNGKDLLRIYVKRPLFINMVYQEHGKSFKRPDLRLCM